MTALNRYEELGPLVRPIIDRLINALAASPSTAAYAARDAYAAARDAARAAYCCYECSRVFNLYNDDDAQDWYFGHDCPSRRVSGDFQKQTANLPKPI